MQIDGLSSECQREILAQLNKSFTPEEWMKYKLYLTFDYPENELPEKVKEYNHHIQEILDRYGKDKNSQ